MTNYNTLLKKIKNKTAKVSVIGLGYVGLPLAMLIANKNYTVYGIDTDIKKINLLKNKKNYIKHINSIELKNLIDKKKLIPSNNSNLLSESDVVVVCVPTPLKINSKIPDLSHLKNACNLILKNARKNSLIIIESTTYPGTTDEIFIPKLNKKFQDSYFISYSPEREDPGNKKFTTKNIPKVIGANEKYSKKLIKEFYGRVFKKVVQVKNIKVAEATKIYENIFRSINIALVNEMKYAFNKFDINIYDVIKASSTKPFGFMPFYPGPGLGGHCIPIDPIYFSWKSKKLGFNCNFIELSEKINSGVPKKITNYVKKNFNEKSKILIIGLAYKKNIDDYRESPSLKIFDSLVRSNYNVLYHDKFILKIPKNRHYQSLIGHKSISLSKEKLKKFDLTILLTDHDYLNKNMIIKNSKFIIDTRNFLNDNKNLVRL